MQGFRMQGEDDAVVGGRVARAVMVVPTYNEIENLADLVARVRRCAPDVDILVVDDASPDGTGSLADRLAADDPGVRVLHRAEKQGLGAAYAAGFRVALDAGYDLIGEMDADGSHRPEQLPLLLDATAEADLVIGSRWVPGGSVVNWPWHRRLLSRAGNLYTRVLLGIGVRDATAGFRVFRREALETIHLERVQSLGYVFQVELAYRALRAGLRVVEVPIEFVERERGASKMTPEVARESLVRITRWGLAQRFRRTERG
jgi:dolichol-phosphate mannosyltransferase